MYAETSFFIQLRVYFISTKFSYEAQVPTFNVKSRMILKK